MKLLIWNSAPKLMVSKMVPVNPKRSLAINAVGKDATWPDSNKEMITNFL